MLIGKVIGFRNVLFKIIQLKMVILKIVKQLPLPIDHRTAGLIEIFTRGTKPMWIVPRQLLSNPPFSCVKHRHLVNPINVLLWSLGQPCY